MFVLVLTLWLNGIPHVHQIQHLFYEESECEENGIALVHQIKRKDWWAPNKTVRLAVECRELTRRPA